MMVSQDFEHSALVPLATLGQPVCQELYRDVAMIRAWASRKNGRNQSVGGNGEVSSSHTGGGNQSGHETGEEGCVRRVGEGREF